VEVEEKMYKTKQTTMRQNVLLHTLETKKKFEEDWQKFFWN
jgi:hypothetical protein